MKYLLFSIALFVNSIDTTSNSMFLSFLSATIFILVSLSLIWDKGSILKLTHNTYSLLNIGFSILGAFLFQIFQIPYLIDRLLSTFIFWTDTIYWFDKLFLILLIMGIIKVFKLNVLKASILFLAFMPASHASEIDVSQMSYVSHYQSSNNTVDYIFKGNPFNCSLKELAQTYIHLDKKKLIGTFILGHSDKLSSDCRKMMLDKVLTEGSEVLFDNFETKSKPIIITLKVSDTFIKGIEKNNSYNKENRRILLIFLSLLIVLYLIYVRKNKET